MASSKFQDKETICELNTIIPTTGSLIIHPIRYIFPALGLGAILSRASQVTDSMVEASSLALAESVTEEERSQELIYPRLERIREIGVHIACRVIQSAQKAVSGIPLRQKRILMCGIDYRTSTATVR